MTSEQAKFILQACRPGGQDAADPAFVEALAQAERDPALKAWLERERAFDSHVVSKCKLITPPDSLRVAILAGGRASRRSQPQWRTLIGIGLAACFALLFGTVAVSQLSGSDAYVDELVQHSLVEMNGPHPRGQPLERYGDLGAVLRDPAKRLGNDLPVNLDKLREIGCRSVQVAGKEVFEICFRRDAYYHLYIARRTDFSCRECEIEPMFRERGEFASVSWVDSEHVFVLVSRAGLDAVKRAVDDPAALAMR
ncbi:hypothetical protein MASR2M8_11400 [Opitutaceae bacterium]